MYRMKQSFFKSQQKNVSVIKSLIFFQMNRNCAESPNESDNYKIPIEIEIEQR